MAEAARSFGALLNGLARRNYFNDAGLTNDILKTEIYPNLADAEFQQLLVKCTGLMKSTISADMDINQLEAFLTSQLRRREGGITEEQANAYRKFWKNQRTKIHDSIVNQTTWNNTVKSMSWRIDIKTQSRHIDLINSPVAIMEIKISNKQNNKGDLHFEMDETKLAYVLKNMQEIENQISIYCQK